MDSFPPPESRYHGSIMDHQRAMAEERASTIAESPVQHNQPNVPTDDPSALITPIKPNEELKAKKKQLQLQLAIVDKSDVPEPATKNPATTKPFKWPPVSSTKSLPPLSGRMADLTKGERGVFGKRNTIEFEVNQECTSIALVPSGNLAVAGFTDGTLRLFDLTGTFVRDKNDPHNPTGQSSHELDGNSSSSEEEMELSSSKGCRRGSNEEVCSRVNQKFGVVACQIHARGVHTSLLMDVAVSEDGLYAFGGVLRGSVELAAVYLGDAENYLNDRFATGKAAEDVSNVGLLDLVRVDRHADAKLKGFGAVARLWNGWEKTRAGDRPEYLLFTGKGIKNIHIWSFKPSRIENGEEQESIWTCLYDTQTNGTSISQLYFRHNGNRLQGISKSDDQKLRVWDLSWEQNRVATGSNGSDRPKRPNYVDVTSTETTVGVCGSYAFALSAASESIINLIPLDAEDVSSPFNVTELALPMTDAIDHTIGNRPSRSGRQQRGELKSVVNVCGLVFDASHALLNLSDGSIVHYSHDESGHPVLVPCSPTLSKTSIDSNICPPLGATLALNQNKKMCLARVGAEGKVVVAVSSYNEPAGRGALMFRALPVSSNEAYTDKNRRFWGFNGLKRKRRQPTVSLVARKEPEPETREMPSPTADDITTLQNTPLPGAKFDKNKQSATTVMPTPAASLKVARKKSTSSRPTHVSDMKTPTTFQVAHNTNERPAKQGVNVKAKHVEQDAMDSQLESLVHQSCKAALNTPAKKKEPRGSIAKKQKVTAEPSTKQAVEKLTLSSPRKRMRKKERDSDNSQNEVKTPVEDNKVCHLGVTVFDRKEDPELPESCYRLKHRTKLLCEKFSPDTVAAKAVTFKLPESTSKKLTTINPVLTKHDEERRKLALKHRAEHEMIRRQVLHTIRYLISTWDIEANSSRSHSSIVESAKNWFNDALADHQVTLNDIMERQMLEAESLAARQTLQLMGRAPTLPVSFPFPEVFEQARNELYAHFQF